MVSEIDPGSAGKKRRQRAGKQLDGAWHAREWALVGRQIRAGKGRREIGRRLWWAIG